MRAMMHCSSTGKIFLAFLYYDNLDLMFADTVMDKCTNNTITDVSALRKELQKVMALGYAVDDQEYHPDVRCVAAPIRDNRGVVVAAIGITAPASSFTKAHIPHFAAQVKERPVRFIKMRTKYRPSNVVKLDKK
jgi:DNA-binding IclR family transcriptional regulator